MPLLASLLFTPSPEEILLVIVSLLGPFSLSDYYSIVTHQLNLCASFKSSTGVLTVGWA